MGPENQKSMDSASLHEDNSSSRRNFLKLAAGALAAAAGMSAESADAASCYFNVPYYLGEYCLSASMGGGQASKYTTQQGRTVAGQCVISYSGTYYVRHGYTPACPRPYNPPVYWESEDPEKII